MMIPINIVTSGAGTKEWLEATRKMRILLSLDSGPVPTSMIDGGEDRIMFARHTRETVDAVKRLFGR